LKAQIDATNALKELTAKIQELLSAHHAQLVHTTLESEWLVLDRVCHAQVACGAMKEHHNASYLRVQHRRVVNQERYVVRVSSIHMQCRLTARRAKRVDSREHLERQSAMSVQWDGTAMKEHLSV
jgi:hypothetical protein